MENIKQKTAIAILILALAIGFALVTTTIVIYGTVGVDAKNFNKDVVYNRDSITIDNDDDNSVDVKLSDDLKTINVVINDLKKVTDYKQIHFKISNLSRYDAIISNIDCYFVDDYEEGKPSPTKTYSNEYILLEPQHNLDGAKILAGGKDSDETYVTYRLIKPYIGDKNNIDTNGDGILDALEVKFQCAIVATSLDPVYKRN